jgi:DNA-binding PadR family transcriptional regulator
MSTAHVLLGLLAGGAKHGYDLKRAHDARMPQAKPLAFGQVYATLARLQRDGLVEASGQDQAGGPERTSFSLTEAGRAALAGWLAEVEPPMPHVTNALFAKVLVALLAADEATARDYLTRQRSAHTGRIRELTKLKLRPEGPVGDVIAADYAIAHVDADLRWLETTLGRVTELNREVHSDSEVRK